MSAEQIAAAIVFFLTVSGALWAIWWRIDGRVKEAKTEVAGQASAAQATATMAREELMAYRTHVAETYVSKQGHREATEQIMEAINAVKTSVDGTNQRIDRMWEAQPQKPRRTS